ncbi:unnamed protein product [Moneuplotes crassus]|uniref:Uncharacterized protein n=2 Tax=Euplotes crassus TaxID=5936 RepID=A0AAD1Y0G4_EUPCR|nr:unnamed protein product [Moneuplotes crassus]
MKLAILAVMIIAISCALALRPTPAKGKDLENYLKGAKDGTFIVLFYDREAPQLRTEGFRNQINSKILSQNPAFNYFEVDIQEGEYNNIVDKMMKIDRTQCKHSPTILVASEGRGYWAHGDGAVDDIAYHMNQYSIDMIRESRERTDFSIYR